MIKIRFIVMVAAAFCLLGVISNYGSAELSALHAFDREACYANCGCDAVGMVAACFDCKQACDRKYWEEFDKEMGTGNEGPRDDSN